MARVRRFKDCALAIADRLKIVTTFSVLLLGANHQFRSHNVFILATSPGSPLRTKQTKKLIESLISRQAVESHDVTVVTLNKLFGSDTLLPVSRLGGGEISRVSFSGSHLYAIALLKDVRDADVCPPEQERALADWIRVVWPDIVLVGMGNPRQELWLAQNIPDVCPMGIAVGALFDFQTGKMSRAPVAMRKARLEWMYRLLQEPSRLVGRYLVGNVVFLGRVALQVAQGERS